LLSLPHQMQGRTEQDRGGYRLPCRSLEKPGPFFQAYGEQGLSGKLPSGVVILLAVEEARSEIQENAGQRLLCFSSDADRSTRQEPILSTLLGVRPMKKDESLKRSISVLAAVWSAVVSTCLLPDPVGAEGVADLQVSHRYGQTFLTWKETEELTADEQIPYEQYKQLTTEWSNRRRYRIYRSSEPIRTVQGLTPIGEAHVLSCWNDCYPSRPRSSDGDLLGRFVIEAEKPPLAANRGLYVHQPQRRGAAYYAVTVVNGRREESEITDSNSTSTAIVESPGEGEPVLQREEHLDEKQAFNSALGPTVLTYVRWEAPPNANRENLPMEFIVGIPKKVVAKPALGLHLHSSVGSSRGGFGHWINNQQGSILLAPNQTPFDWWTGYHEGSDVRNWGAATPNWKEGRIFPYTQNRLCSLVQWALRRFRCDPGRSFVAGNSMGGSGAAMLAFRRPELFAWAASRVGVHRPHLSPTYAENYSMSYGPPEEHLLFEDGTMVWDYFDDVWFLKQYPWQETPFITVSNGRNDDDIGWKQAVDLARVLQETKRPHLFSWGMNGHRQSLMMPLSLQPSVMPLDLRVDLSVPAFTRCSLDQDPGDGDPSQGDPQGGMNLYLTWQTSDIVDRPNRWEISLSLVDAAPQDQCVVDVTPRRLQVFATDPGTEFEWSNVGSDGLVQQGRVRADEYGLVTVERLQVTKLGNRLSIWKP
jgi:pimeloyl-ACP methyl ester carboxylesterase